MELLLRLTEGLVILLALAVFVERGAVVVFAALTRLRPDPVRAFTVVAAVVLLISWIPDLALYATGAPGATVAEVLSLMSLHLVAAGLAVFLLGRYGLRPGTGRGSSCHLPKKSSPRGG